LRQLGRDLSRGEAGADPGALLGEVDVDAAQLAQIDDEGAVATAVAGKAVAAGSHRDLDVVAYREVDGGRDVAGIGGANDGQRRALVGRVPDLGGRGVRRV